MLHLTSQLEMSGVITLLPHMLPKHVKVHLYLYLYEDKTLSMLSVTIQTFYIF